MFATVCRSINSLREQNFAKGSPGLFRPAGAAPAKPHSGAPDPLRPRLRRIAQGTCRSPP